MEAPKREIYTHCLEGKNEAFLLFSFGPGIASGMEADLENLKAVGVFFASFICV
jgi:hypothetical protein